MGKKIVSGTMLTLLLIGMLTLAFNIQLVKASGTIYIRTDGSVDPPEAPIQRDGDVYTLTGNIYDSIVVERDNIVVDGAGYTLQGTGSGTGVTLSRRSNITIKNMKIKAFGICIYLRSYGMHTGNSISGNTITNNGYGIWLDASSNTISGNNITNNYYGIQLTGSSNTISGNTITNSYIGIYLYSSAYNIISGNTITDNSYGMWLDASSSHNIISGNNITNNYYGIHHYYCGNFISGNTITNNYKGIHFYHSQSTISGNTITNNSYGMWLDAYSNKNFISGNNITNNSVGVLLKRSNHNTIYHNNFVNNTQQVDISMSWYGNFWDDGYPSGGNYWSDYSIRYPTVADDYHGENQDILGNDGIWDSPYVIDPDNQDNYPFVNPWFLDLISPVADAGPDQIVHEDTPVILNGEASSDNVGIVSYVWTFTDVTPQTLTGANPTYTFTTPGIYTVTLNVTDAAGNWATDTVMITVLDVTSPVADAGPDQTVDEDTLVTFDGSVSTDNVGITSYTWTFVDVTPQTLTGVNPTYTFQTPGIYTVTLNVTDARGNWDTDEVIITVLDVTNPVADAGPDQTVDEDIEVTFDGSGSTDNVGVISWTWTFTDVTPQTLTGVNPTYTFTTPGIYTVTLEVSDAAGNHATDTVTITVLSLAPEDLMRRLMETIETWNLPEGTETSLTLKLEETIHLLNKGNDNGAIHKLMDFINQVEALRDEKLTNEQADYLISEAQRIIDLIEG